MSMDLTVFSFTDVAPLMAIRHTQSTPPNQDSDRKPVSVKKPSMKLQEIFTDANIGKFQESDQEFLKYMYTSYSDLLNDLEGPTWTYRIESFNTKAGYLASLATVSTFLGGVQVSLVAFSATINASPVIHNFVSFFSYSALSLDAFGAVFALFTSGSLLSTTSKAKALASEELDEDFKHYVVDFQSLCDSDSEKHNPSNTRPLKLEDVPAMWNCLQKFALSREKKRDEAKRLAFVIDHHLRDVFEVIWVIIAGVVFFFASLITFIVGTQPTGVLASSIAVVGIAALVLLARQVRRHPGIRRQLKRRLGLGSPRQTLASDSPKDSPVSTPQWRLAKRRPTFMVPVPELGPIGEVEEEPRGIPRYLGTPEL